jgi:hypothetical protein
MSLEVRECKEKRKTYEHVQAIKEQPECSTLVDSVCVCSPARARAFVLGLRMYARKQL